MIDLLVIYTDNLDTAHAFYRDLGLEFTKERHGLGPEHYATELRGGIIFELYPATTKRPANPGLRLGLTLPARTRAPGRHTLTDPDGRTLVLTLTETAMTETEIHTAVTEHIGPNATTDIHRHPTGALSLTIHTTTDVISIDGQANTWAWTLNPSDDSAGHDHTTTSLTQALTDASNALN